MAGAGESSSDGSTNHRKFCQPCKKQNRQSDAIRFCLDCQEYLCKSCLELHGYFAALQDHTTVNIDDNVINTTQEAAGSNTDATRKVDIPTERCPKHPEKLVDMYCKNHDLVACSLCFLPHYK